MNTPRWRIGAVCAAIGVAVFLQAPGRVVADTKLDLALDPADFIRRALHLWEPQAAFGHVQNQAAGYLFPMAPAFLAGHIARLPPWVTQRLWLTVLLGVSCWGTVRLADVLGIGRPSHRLMAGAIYALSPAMLGPLGIASGGQIPAALLPWVVLPLTGPSPRRAAARSALAVLAMGAVNATATLCVLPLPALYLLTRRRSHERRTLIWWWIGGVAAACSWWFVALALQARYGTNFVPYTESASITTATTSAFEVLRGTGYWLTYLFHNGAWLPGGWAVVSQPLAIVAAGLLAGVGLVGLVRADMPERTFLVVAVLVGAVAVGVGYGGALSGPQAGLVRHLLDGPLSGLRNVSKFEAVLRLPLALGAAHAVATFANRAATRWLGVVAVGLAVVGAATPLTERTLFPAGSFTAVPAYWTDAAHWLDIHTNGARALVLPAAPFGEYTWGRPLDEPLQAIAHSPWVVRDLIPLGADGSARLLDAIDLDLAGNRPPPGLQATLQRAGVGYVLVRNDLDMTRAGSAEPVYLGATLSRVPGLSLAAGFGPLVPAAMTTDRLVASVGTGGGLPVMHEIDIYRVDGVAGPVRSYPAAGVVQVSGGPEAMMGVASRPDVAGHAVIAAGDPAATGLDPSVDIVTDGLQRRDTDFGAAQQNLSYVLQPDAAARTRSPISGTDHQTVAVVKGVVALSASSSGPATVRLPEDGPFSAFDGDATTAWVAGGSQSNGAFLELTFDHPMSFPSMQVRLLVDSPVRSVVNRLVVETTTGFTSTRLAPIPDPQTVPIPAGLTTRLRIVITDTLGAYAGIREITIPGIQITRPLRVPADASKPGPLVFQRSTSDSFDATRWDEESSLDRLFTVPGTAPVSFALSGTVLARPGQVAPTDAAPMLAVHASSFWRGLLAFAPANVVDGDTSTAWVADPADPKPTVWLSWWGTRVLDTVVVSAAPAPINRPTQIELVAGTEHRSVTIGPDGVGHFPALETYEVAVTVTRTATPGGGAAGVLTPAATGIAELRFPALDDLRSPPVTSSVVVPCGQGPSVVVDGVAHAVSVSGTNTDLAKLAPLTFIPCDGPLTLAPGSHRLQATPGAGFRVDAVSLDPVIAAPMLRTPPVARTMAPGRWSPDARTVVAGAGPATVLSVAENFNPGWRATLNGVTLKPVRLEGWSQGWVVPAGAAGVIHLSFTPQRVYLAGLIIGLLGAILLLAAALWPDRRLRRPPVLAGSPGWTAAGALGLFTAGLLGGPLAAVVPFALLIGARWWRPRLLIAAAMVAATATALTAHGAFPSTHAGPFSAAAQACAVLALTILACDLHPRRR